MNRRRPPAAACWLLRRLPQRMAPEAFQGDLFEEFSAGRSSAWFWSQTLMALFRGVLRELRHHAPILLFAALWSVPSPALWLWIPRFLAHTDLEGRIWVLPWPWSTIVSLALTLSLQFLPLWTGTMLCLSLCRGRRRFARTLWIRALWIAPAVFLPLIVAVLAVPFHAFIDLRTATVSAFLGDSYFLILRLPSWLALSVAVWSALPPEPRRAAQPPRAAA